MIRLSGLQNHGMRDLEFYARGPQVEQTGVVPELAGQADRIGLLRTEARRRGLTLLTATRDPALSHTEVLRNVLRGPGGRTAASAAGAWRPPRA